MGCNGGSRLAGGIVMLVDSKNNNPHLALLPNVMHCCRMQWWSWYSDTLQPEWCSQKWIKHQLTSWHCCSQQWYMLMLCMHVIGIMCDSSRAIDLTCQCGVQWHVTAQAISKTINCPFCCCHQHLTFDALHKVLHINVHLFDSIPSRCTTWLEIVFQTYTCWQATLLLLCTGRNTGGLPDLINYLSESRNSKWKCQLSAQAQFG